jgi:type II secretory pathway component GspD/PulD (secretin)
MNHTSGNLVDKPGTVKAACKCRSIRVVIKASVCALHSKILEGSCVMKRLVYFSLAIGLYAVGSSFSAGDALAQQALEIIPLRHRSADQVIPVLRPLLEPGGAISGQGYQLILRSSTRNLQDLKKTLAAIDSPQRQLEISVRFDETGERSGASTEVRSRLGERVDQRVRVLEGARAFIATGQTRPVHQNTISTGPLGTVISDNTVFQELATGFEVVPRMSGDRVLLDIQPRRDRPGAHGPASIDSQQVASTVSARLGEWIEIGSSAENIARHERGAVSTATARSSADRRVWVKVEELQR